MTPKPAKLPRAFYDRPTLEVCRDLIGCEIVYRSGGEELSARIVEVEAYIGVGDPACHAAKGKTERNTVMFGPPGHAYIYFIYGMYHCLNFVTEAEGFPAAVLLRAAEPIKGISRMKAISKVSHDWQLLNGPGKFCRSFDLTRAQNGIDLTGDCLFVRGEPSDVKEVATATRIGISAGEDKLWRFFDPQSAAVSKPALTGMTKGK